MQHKRPHQQNRRRRASRGANPLFLLTFFVRFPVVSNFLISLILSVQYSDIDGVANISFELFLVHNLVLRVVLPPKTILPVWRIYGPRFHSRQNHTFCFRCFGQPEASEAAPEAAIRHIKPWTKPLPQVGNEVWSAMQKTGAQR